MNREKYLDIIEAANLGALACEGELIGDAMEAVSAAWRAPYGDLEVNDDLSERLTGALSALNECYDDEGYETDAPSAHEAKAPVCAALDEIAAALYRQRKPMFNDEGAS